MSGVEVHWSPARPSWAKSAKSGVLHGQRLRDPAVIHSHAVLAAVQGLSSIVCGQDGKCEGGGGNHM